MLFGTVLENLSFLPMLELLFTLSPFRFDPILNEYLFDRRPRFFPDILGLYQVGNLFSVLDSAKNRLLSLLQTKQHDITAFSTRRASYT